ncbi:MAG: hypothetical protein RIT81_13535 [Deltaproteobacteria bacterium]
MNKLAPVLLPFAVACQETTVLIASDHDGGSFRDGGLDAGIPPCWGEERFVGSEAPTRGFGRVVTSNDEHFFVSSYIVANEDHPLDLWEVSRIARTETGWVVDRTQTSRDPMIPGHLIEAMSVADDGLWLGVPDGDGVGRVWHTSLDLDILGEPLNAADNGLSFGTNLVRDGPWLLVAEPSRSRSGAVDVFTVQGGLPTYVDTLMPDDPIVGEAFGSAIALRGDRLLIGAPTTCGRVETCPERGRVLEYVASGGTFSFLREHGSESTRTRSFGSSITWIDDERAWISAAYSYHCVDECFDPGNRTPALPGTGDCDADQTPCRYVGSGFVLRGTTLEEHSPAELATAGFANLQWGGAAAAGQRWIAIGAHTDPSCSYANPLSNSCNTAGSVHVYFDTGADLVEHRYLRPSDLYPRMRFGEALAMSGRTLAIGASLHCGTGPASCTETGNGAVYVYSGCAAP